MILSLISCGLDLLVGGGVGSKTSNGWTRAVHCGKTWDVTVYLSGSEDEYHARGVQAQRSSK